ncbi:QWRF motif-containing protein 3-like [Pistacia vera]|uniref:QWRF motif-containing protein 3-like n=1 Tax=Pistacia vera TaxID=55513 RepID=UPI0012636E58|nr:QWRF motif-containing protein 3-like [Pistacia vera]
MKDVNETLLTDQSLKPRRPKSREVSSRFLSPSSTPSRDMGIPSSNQVLSPLLSVKPSTPPDARKHRSLDQDSAGGFIRGLWPSSTTTSQSSNKNIGTLAEHLGNERLRDYLDRKTDEKSSYSSVFSLSRQRSCSEFSRLENEKEKEKGSAKENHRPFLGGSMRYTGKLKFPGKSSSSSSSSNSLSNNSGIVPGRMSVDENALYRKSHRRSDPLMDNLESESECSDICSTTDISSPGMGKGSSHSRKSGRDVSSKYLQDVPNRPRRLNSDSNIPVSLDSSPRLKKFTIKNAIKRANSLTGYGSATSQWALSPGRSGSPPMSVESKQRPMSFSSLKPPSSPSRAKGVEKLLNMGLDLFKSKKTSSSPLGSGDVETGHRLRMLQNQLMQWRYANARADAVKEKMTNQVENNLLCAWDTITKLGHSVLHKKLQLQKEKLEMKLDFILMSQIKPLESWGDMERQHLSAVSMMKECLHSVVCKIPLTEGAKVDPQSASIAIRHALDLTASIKSILSNFLPSVGKNISLLSELADTIV